eukprot:Gb_06316 [translate_table: standard]
MRVSPSSLFRATTTGLQQRIWETTVYGVGIIEFDDEEMAGLVMFNDWRLDSRVDIGLLVLEKGHMDGCKWYLDDRSQVARCLTMSRTRQMTACGYVSVFQL